jgi:TP901 family phage tail tape measure protein
VTKYTGQTKAEVEAMNEDFKQMDTRTSREQLNDLAGVAGRLGITGKQAIEEFVSGADTINVALGDDLGDGAVDKIGKLAQMFGEDKTKGLRGAMLATGSAVNDLAQSSSANAGYIVDFTADLSGVGIQAKMSQSQIMGFASALDQNMQEESTASTVFSQLITKMYQDPARFAKIAGMQVKEFTHLMKTDANSGLIKFLEAMKSKGGFDSMAPLFQEMKLDGTRAVGVLSSVATHIDQVKEAQKTAAASYAAGTSVVQEFNTQNSSVQAQLDKAKKQFLDLSIDLGQKLMPVARYAISTTSLGIKALSTLITFTFNHYRAIIILSLAIVGNNCFI